MNPLGAKRSLHSHTPSRFSASHPKGTPWLIKCRSQGQGLCGLDRKTVQGGGMIWLSNHTRSQGVYSMGEPPQQQGSTFFTMFHFTAQPITNRFACKYQRVTSCPCEVSEPSPKQRVHSLNPKNPKYTLFLPLPQGCLWSS